LKILPLMKRTTKPVGRQRRSSGMGGFTLVEVMVAVLIVSVAISALLTRIMTTVDSTARLRDKAIASWVALNQMELVYIANENPKSRAYNTLLNKEITGKSEMAGREWHWKVTPQKGLAEGSIPIHVTVTDTEDGDSPIVTLIGTIDALHLPN
jgi:general secretion pathway protein I